MQLCLLGGRLTFKDLLDQIDATARTIQLIAEQLIGGAGRSTESTMHALAQNGIRFLTLRRVFDEVSEIGLHRQKSVYMRRGLKIPAGSKACLRLRWIRATAGASG